MVCCNRMLSSFTKFDKFTRTFTAEKRVFVIL